ncbi:integrase core domain-containing protein [Streptococcus sp. DD13]|uniref:integrase core domain-containing protein n=1 Tax=Streptococcus sp. DD13 TaxID=1777881 RepID=UPI0007949730|nr:integrase core domain-containing protein [Streptococcus sp. DD13]KXT78494.1 Mobile element protein [Streptococcus sp. DD13]
MDGSFQGSCFFVILGDLTVGLVFFSNSDKEFFFGYEKTFQSLEQLEQAIVDYIDYYNNKRIKIKLKGLSPVKYRTKSFT